MSNLAHSSIALKDALLHELLPTGMLASRAWLLSKGLSKDRLDNYVKSGRLKKLARGVYCHPYAVLNWQNVVASFSQTMGLPAYAGGATALEYFGLSQYLNLSDERIVEVYSPCAEPSWLADVAQHVQGVRFRWHKTQRIWETSSIDMSLGVFTQAWSTNDDAQSIAMPERAFIELLYDVPNAVSFEHADEIMQGLVTLSPRKLNSLLTVCKSIKAKRLFFWFANRYAYSWQDKLDSMQFDLGKGKRVIQKGGRLDSRYLITVPEQMQQAYPNGGESII